MPRLIDADALMKWLQSPTGFRTNCEDCTSIDCLDCIIEEAIANAPTIDAEPVRHGRWVWFENWLESTPANPRECLDCGWQCSECKNALEDMVGGYWDNPDEMPALKHCPECGAIMDGGVSDED